jgi:ABC-type transport system involved in multi-copper enzyme maturation permease subunit
MNALISWPVARATARERGLSALTLAIVAVLVLLGTLRSSADAWGAEAFSGFAAAWFFLLTLLLGAGLLSDEVESGHAQLVLLRPLTRAQWVGGRFAGAAFVLCAAGALAWAASLIAALTRGGFGELPGRLLVLPLALLPALGWLATLLAIGAAARGWTNAGILVAARVGWGLLHFSAPLAFPKLGLSPLLDAVSRHFGPQDALMLARQVQYGERFEPSTALWDLLWLFAAWLVAVRVFNLRELARRRA